MAGIPFDAPLNMNNNKITNLAPGVASTDAANVSQLNASGFPAQPVVSGTPSTGQVLTATGSTTANWQTPAVSGGTVTSVSVASANGLGGTVATPTTTPAITLNTSVTGLLKGNGTAISAAVSGTDYLAPLPWQFTPEAYGAKGNGKIIGDATIAGGALSTLTSASAAFTSADTGKYILVNGALGNNAYPLICTITFVNATTVTLSTAATSAVTNASAIYGTDDTAAFNSCLAAGATYATGAGGNYHFQVMLSNKFYIIAGQPVVTGTWGTTICFYSQLPLPYPNANGLTQKLLIDIIGVGASEDNEYWISTVPGIQGSCLVSMPPTNPAALQGGQQNSSVIGGPSGNGGFTGGFANAKCYVDGVTVVIPFLGNQWCYDFSVLAAGGGGKAAAKAFAPVSGPYNQISSLPNLGGFVNSVGVAMPTTANNDDCTFTSFAAEGVAIGAILLEHATFERLSCIYNFDGIIAGGSNAATHGSFIGYYSCEATNNAIVAGGGAASQFPLVIGLMDVEVITTDIKDANNVLTGRINWANFNTTAPVVVGAANLEIVNMRLSRAVQAAPNYTLGTAFQNPWWKSMFITLNSGTTTGILIGPTSATCTTSVGTATTSPVSFKLPSGWWFNIQGSVKPTTFIAVPD